jgi:glutamate formiminotransferase
MSSVANQKIVECVPNISEGCDKKKIAEIVSVVERGGVNLLDVSSDFDHNRSVVTFAGEPKAVKEAAFDFIKKAASIIDMSKHKGEHPRMGAVDVCPFAPVLDISMKDCVKLAHDLGEKLAEAGISGYYYEEAATVLERKNLADVRKGEYEALQEKFKKKEWKPDFGPDVFNPKFGAVAVGARHFLIAFNVNLKRADVSLAKDIAKKIRHSSGGIFKTVKAIGIDMSDKGYSQVSMNLTDYKTDSLPVVFNKIKELAEYNKVEIQSSEIVGLLPADALKGTSPQYLKLVDFDENKQIIEKALNVQN